VTGDIFPGGAYRSDDDEARNPTPRPGEPIRSDRPHDRLTELCAVMTDALDAALEPGELPKCAVFLQDGERGGLQLHGYDDDTEAIVDLFLHLKALFESRGQTFMVVPIGGE
jgi:hypothetical protein